MLGPGSLFFCCFFRGFLFSLVYVSKVLGRKKEGPKVGKKEIRYQCSVFYDLGCKVPMYV